MTGKTCVCGRRLGKNARPTTLCRRCRSAERTVWTRGRLILAIRRWAELFGDPPSAIDWDLNMARRKCGPDRLLEIENRHKVHDWPPRQTTIAHFGRWNLAIEAAGFVPVRVGERRR